jgi:hypothetical protein
MRHDTFRARVQANEGRRRREFRCWSGAVGSSFSFSMVLIACFRQTDFDMRYHAPDCFFGQSVFENSRSTGRRKSFEGDMVL